MIVSGPRPAGEPNPRSAVRGRATGRRLRSRALASGCAPAARLRNVRPTRAEHVRPLPGPLRAGPGRPAAGAAVRAAAGPVGLRVARTGLQRPGPRDRALGLAADRVEADRR